jgi:hypothetical protein
MFLYFSQNSPMFIFTKISHSVFFNLDLKNQFCVTTTKNIDRIIALVSVYKKIMGYIVLYLMFISSDSSSDHSYKVFV